MSSVCQNKATNVPLQSKNMWIFKKNTLEWIPFNEKDVEKVFKDAQNGWAIKYRNGNVEHIDDATYEESLKPLLAPAEP